ncbi:MAG TPA: DoxX family protein [Bacteroidota bacterium]|nr:DoxX family protein [Bacteroidota bacterium]
MAAGTSEDFGKLLLRVAVGFFVLVHSYFKLRHGVEWIMGPLGELGLPSLLAYGAYLGGIVAPILVLAGYRTRVAASLIALTMVVAIILLMKTSLGHGGSGILGIELETVLLLGAIALIFIGGGRFGVTRGKHSWD